MPGIVGRVHGPHIGRRLGRRRLGNGQLRNRIRWWLTLLRPNWQGQTDQTHKGG
jgi:hypothetical protein